MNYELGKQYELEVIDIRKDNAGYNYIALTDGKNPKEYRVYNILKCQYEGLPKSVYVKVTAIDVGGRVKFRQDEARLYEEHYKKGNLYPFSIIDVKEDYNSKVPFYIIEDDFSQHRIYFKGEQKFQIGDFCNWKYLGLNDKGFAVFEEFKSDIDSDGKPILTNVDDENLKIEYKTSIVYPPGGNGIPDVDKQLYNVIRELAAFMNTEGGTLYIGIHDKTKEIIGIKNDYRYLNHGEDEFNGSYSQNTDGYELKIRNAIDRLCPSVANSLININFHQKEGAEYCFIDVHKAKRPIWVKGCQLFVRQGNRTKLYKGDEITFYITERMNLSIRDVIDTDDLTTLSEDKMKSIIRDLLNERKISIKPSVVNVKDGVEYWIVWYNNGKWIRQKEKSIEKNVFIQLPVKKTDKDSSIVFCYDTGKVNIVSLKVFRKGVNLNILQEKNGWCSKGNPPMNIFITHQSHYLAGYSVDCHGNECVKLHSLTDFSSTNSANNQGSSFIPQGCNIKMYKLVGSEYHKKMQHLICAKLKKASDPGVPLNTVMYEDEISFLANL